MLMLSNCSITLTWTNQEIYIENYTDLNSTTVRWSCAGNHFYLCVVRDKKYTKWTTPNEKNNSTTFRN